MKLILKHLIVSTAVLLFIFSFSVELKGQTLVADLRQGIYDSYPYRFHKTDVELMYYANADITGSSYWIYNSTLDTNYLLIEEQFRDIVDEPKNITVLDSVIFFNLANRIFVKKPSEFVAKRVLPDTISIGQLHTATYHNGSYYILGSAGILKTNLEDSIIKIRESGYHPKEKIIYKSHSRIGFTEYTGTNVDTMSFFAIQGDSAQKTDVIVGGNPNIFRPGGMSAWGLNDSISVFILDLDGEGRELFSYNFNSGKVQRVKNVRPGSQSGVGYPLGSSGNSLLLPMYEDSKGWELGASKGLGRNTSIIFEQAPGSPNGLYSGLGSFNDFVFFNSTDQTPFDRPRQVWKSNGTTNGTSKVHDFGEIVNLRFSTSSRYMAVQTGLVQNDKRIFLIDKNDNVSPLQLNNVSFVGFGATDIAVFDKVVLFTANDADTNTATGTGRELYKMSISDPLSSKSQAANRMGEEQGLKFIAGSIVISEDSNISKVEFYNSELKRVKTLHGSENRMDYTSFKKGLYFIRISSKDGDIRTSKLFIH